MDKSKPHPYPMPGFGIQLANWMLKVETWIREHPGQTALGILISLAAILRFYNLGAAPLWYDESFTDLATALPLAKMFQALAGDVHPPAHYLMLWGLQRLGLGGPWGLRLLSALFSLASVWLAGRLARKITGSRLIQMITVFLMALNPMNLHYAQEARMYAMLQLLVLLGMLAIYNRSWILLGASTWILMLTHTYGLFYASSLALVALVAAREHWKKWIPAFGLAGLGWLPWGWVMYQQMLHLQSSGYWIQAISVGRILRVISKMVFSFAMPNGMELGGMILIGAGITFLAIWLGRNIVRSDTDQREWIPLIILAAMPLLLALLASWVYRPVLLFRPLLGSLPFALILVAIVLGNPERPAQVALAVLLIPGMLALSFGYHKYNLINKSDGAEWIQTIREGWQSGDVVYSLNDSAALAMIHRAPDLPSYKMPDCPGQASLGALTGQTRQALGIRELPRDELDGRAWVVVSVSPVSPACEVEAAEQYAEMGKVMRDIYVSEFVDAGVILIGGQN